MLYIYMLGYDMDFGHMETVSLISAPKYPEKQVGYIVTSCLLNENHDFLKLVINTVRNDIIGNNETFQCLALTMVGNIGGRDFSESLASDVQKILLSNSCRPIVRKKAALCLLRLYRKNPDAVNVDGWSERMVHLLDERDIGVLTAVMSLLVSLVAKSQDAYWSCVPKCVRILERLTRGQDIPQEYTYYGIPSPWLQVKTMRVLQYFPAIEDPNIRKSLFETLQRILLGTDVVKNVNKNNASHAVLFEALALVMHLNAEKEMLSQCVALLGKFIAVREPNIRYLGLENMTRMLLVVDVQDIIKKHQAQIITSLKDPDISIRRRSLDLLYGMCDVTNAKEIVEELLQYLTKADFGIREELALKAAILSESFATDLDWYVDVILQLIEKAGDFVSDDIWYRVVQFVTNDEHLQVYAAAKALDYLDKPAVHETMVKLAGYLLGEYSHLLARRPGCTPKDIFDVIYDKFAVVSIGTKALLLSAFVKILLHSQPQDPDLRERVLEIFKRYECSVDAEVQQRCIEYLTLCAKGPSMVDIMAEMPKFPVRQSALLKKAGDAERDVAEESATKLRVQQQNSTALVVVEPQSNGAGPPILTPSAAPVQKKQASPSDLPPSAHPAALPVGNGHTEVSAVTAEDVSVPSLPEDPVTEPTPPPEPAPAPSGANLLADLLAPLAIEAPPGYAAPDSIVDSSQDPGPSAGTSGLAPMQSSGPADALALALYDGPSTKVQPIGSVEDWFNALVIKDSGILYEDPFVQIGIKSDWRGIQGRLVLFLGNKHNASLTNVRAVVLPPPHLRFKSSPVPDTIPPRAQVQCPFDVFCLRASRETAVLEFSYNNGNIPVSAQLKLPVLINKFLQPVTVSANDFVARWRALAGPPLKLQEVVRNVRPMPLIEMANLFNSLHIGVATGLDPNENNIVSATTFYSESAQATLCLIRVETDPSDRTQLRLTVGSQDLTTTYELMEYIKQQLIDTPPPTMVSPNVPTTIPTNSELTGPAALLNGLI
ncbi:AP-2 complex subunit alpha-2 isoform X2 [Physcomitrium patens]|nr:AP-2 complex subunit alpha-2-like isoform X2 [Physcomitrium patens]|eukprot:XP_024401232.1 AP-2 complex subunit alpha-2-like isoform X2 [Physcomitrella patens]